MADMHISLFSAAAAALITFWLAMRCGKVRMAEKIMHGDGGNALMLRRMRAQANFTEYTPIALVLIVLLDLSDVHTTGLALTALAFMIGRVLHAIGMDAEGENKPRMIGMLLTMPLLLGWAIWAVLVGAKIV